jgi:NitT/TauT family transport system ATP-binding protein
MTALLRFDGVGLAFDGKVVIDTVSFDVDEGEFVCVIGPSGCGKTTLLRMAAGLLPATRGAVQVRGQGVHEPARDVAVVFQDYTRALLPWRTAAGNVRLALEAAGVPAGQQAERVDELLSRVGLHGHAAQHPSRLSGGMQQRLQIARALAQRPRLLLMDEPFGALDAMTRQSLQDELLALVRDSGMAVLFVTHDLEEAIYLGDRVVALESNPGRVNRIVPVDIPAPRDQLTTRESAGFLRLRHALYGLMQH